MVVKYWCQGYQYTQIDHLVVNHIFVDLQVDNMG